MASQGSLVSLSALGHLTAFLWPALYANELSGGAIWMTESEMIS